MKKIVAQKALYRLDLNPIGGAAPETSVPSGGNPTGHRSACFESRFQVHTCPNVQYGQNRLMHWTRKFTARHRRTPKDGRG